MADDNKTLGEVLHDARTKRKMSLRDVTKKLDITPSYLSDIENDRRIPSEEVLQKLADLLGLDHNDLMARAGRLGEDALRYLMKTPAAGVLFRRMAEKQTTGEMIEKLLRDVERKKGQS